MNKNFTTRLNKAKDAAGLTIEELACWFGGMSKQAVWMWLAKGRLPQLYRRAQAEKALGYLEKELAKKKSRLPVPMSVRLGDRLEHVRKIRADYDR